MRVVVRGLRRPGQSAIATASINTVLGLRGLIERAAERRRLGLSVLVILAVLLVLIAFHPLADEALEVAALGCAALVLLAGPLGVRREGPPPTATAVSSPGVRASPAARARPQPLRTAHSLPLRL